MLTFFKAQAASVTATAVDFFVYIMMFEVFGVWYVAATVCGTISGALAHFLLSRLWVFQATGGKIHAQGLKYFMVWAIYLLLSTLFIFLITDYLGLNPIMSKIIVASCLSISYNYFLHKKFVFKQ